MKVFIMEKDRITRYNLPLKIDDNFSISHNSSNLKEEILITFEAVNNTWRLKSNGSITVYNNGYEVDSVDVYEYSCYYIKPFFSQEYLNIFILPSITENTYNLSYTNLNLITIGKSRNCNIIYNFSLINDIHAEIKKNDNDWIISSHDGCQVFLNNIRVTESKLKIGDVIFINGLKIIWMKDFFNINNPNNLVSVVGLTVSKSDIKWLVSDVSPVSEMEKNINLYGEDDYFFHTPRIREIIETKTFKIDPPPGSNIKEELPFILSMGTRLTMLASSVAMFFSFFDGLSSGKRSFMSVLPQMIACIAMVVGSFVFPTIIAKFQKRRDKKKEALRQRKYKEYLNEKEKMIQLELNHQSQIMQNNNLPLNTLYNIVGTNNKKFWSREINDDDFLNIRLGIGKIEPNIIIDAPQEHFSLEVDNLLSDVYNLQGKFKYQDDMPIITSLIDKKVSACLFNCNYKQNYLNGIILQLIAYHSSMDLKIVIITNDEKQKDWNYLRFLPHIWSDDKSQRFFATTLDEAKDVSNFLVEEFKKRKNSNGKNVGDESQETEKSDLEFTEKEFYKYFSPYYIIINDDYKIGMNTPIINNVINNKKNYGFSVMFVADSMKSLPAECNTFIEIGENEGAILEKNFSSDCQIVFKPEYDKNLDMTLVTKKIANVPIMPKEGTSVLPQMLSFLEMYGVSKIDQLNILNRWQQNNPVKSLGVPVGVHANGDLFQLDLHEKFHGPHGLIAGSTGSGKSEFIITYILSMAINFHPYEIQFVLIDYKGGGLAGAFENKETGVKIPHLAGTITNLDTAEMNRTLVSIDSELKRRQRIFNEVRDRLGEGTIDIYKYQRLYREGQVEEPMAHLFIISDEFAELKKSQPDFMQELISTARIGRSLGVHLILATQKPSGVVNDQIWTNSKFKVCLKVQDKSDSMEMLKRPEAASIKETGRFYLQVGYDDLFDIGQSGWAGAKYVPSDKIIHKVDDSIEFVDNVGQSIKTIKDIDNIEDNKIDYGEQLTNIVKYICNLGKKEKIVTHKLWLDKLPANIFITNLKKKYNYKFQPYFINPIIGEYDNPREQLQNIVTLDLTHSGNTVIIGQNGSGKEKLLSTILLSTVMEHTPDEVNFYILDFGSGILKMFNNFPYIGEIVSLEDNDLLYDTLDMVNDEFQIRKQKFVDYGGSYVDYCSNSGEKLPLMVVIINNYDVFDENYNKLAESIVSLYRDGGKYGIIFIVSAITTNSIRSRILQNFPNKICLRIPNEDDYRSFMDAPKGLIPANIEGRGLIEMNDTAYEFQTAQFVEKNQLLNVVREYAKKMNEAYIRKAKKVLTVPKVVTTELISQYISDLTKVPIGFNMSNKNVHYYNFLNTKFIPILANYIEDDEMSFVYSLVEILKKISNTNVYIIDLANVFEKNIDGVIKFNSDFDNVINQMCKNIIKCSKENSQDYYMIVGVGQLSSKLNNNTKLYLDNLLLNVNSINNCHFIFVDIYDSYKALSVEPWYQSSIDKSYGLWMGVDVANQLAINAGNISLEEKRLNFRYMMFSVSNGKHSVIKYVVNDSGDKNEE